MTEDGYTEEELGELRLMLASKGWQIFCETLADEADAKDSVELIGSESQLFYRKGEVDALNRVLNLDAMLADNDDETF